MRCEIEALVQDALGKCAIAKEDGGDGASLLHLMRERTADCDGQAGTDDAVRPEHADSRIRDVHRAAAALAHALGPAHDLEEEAVEVEALGQCVAVAAMIGGERIGGLERRAHARSDALLADREMNEARHFAVGEKLGKTQLGLADQPHGPQEIEKGRAGEGGQREDPRTFRRQ